MCVRVCLCVCVYFSMEATVPSGPPPEDPIDCDVCRCSWLLPCATLACSFSVCILSSNNGAWRTFSLGQAFGCSIHLWGSTNPPPCCYSAVAPPRSTAPLSLVAQSSVGADGGQLHPLAAVHSYRLFLLEGWLLAAQNDKNSLFAPVGAVCATLDNIPEMGRLLWVWH